MNRRQNTTNNLRCLKSAVGTNENIRHEAVGAD